MGGEEGGVRLAERCPVCSSTVWCGRPCLSAPSKLTAPQVNEQVNEQTVDAVEERRRKNVEKALRWRARNSAKYRAYMREYQRKRRKSLTDS